MEPLSRRTSSTEWNICNNGGEKTSTSTIKSWSTKDNLMRKRNNNPVRMSHFRTRQSSPMIKTDQKEQKEPMVTTAHTPRQADGSRHGEPHLNRMLLCMGSMAPFQATL